MPSYNDNDKYIIKSLAFLTLLFPRFQLSEETIAAYVQILGDLPAELVEQAVGDIGSRNTFFPSAGEIRTAAVEIASRQNRAPTAYEAWGEVMRLSSSVGRGSIPKFSHPIIGEMVKSIGGWTMICNSENAVADRARFVASFDTFVKRAKYDALTLPSVRQYTDALGSGKANEAMNELAAGLRVK